MATVTYEVTAEGVARVTLNRPEVHNALDQLMIDELDACLSRAEDESAVRVVVLSGRGKSFCSGHDLELKNSELGGIARPDEPEARWRYEYREFFRKGLRLKRFPKPTIAQVHGHCLAAGLALALSCDLVYADESARFGDPVLRMGALGAELLLLPWAVGLQRTKEMLFRGRAIDAQTAHEWGLATVVVPVGQLEAAAAEAASDIAAMPPFAVRLMKRSLELAERAAGVDAALEHHFDLHVLGHTTAEAMNLMSAGRPASASAFIRKRDASFVSQVETDPPSPERS